MKKTSIRLISLFLVIVLAAFLLTGCALTDGINSLIGSIYGDTIVGNNNKPDKDGFSIEGAINEITTSKMSSSVTITVDHFNRGTFGMLTDSATVLGSGSIIMCTTGTSEIKLYVLTNAHCVKSLPDRQYKSITMTDYRGNEYTGGQILTDSVSEAYDLAVVTFTCTSTTLEPIPLAKKNPDIGDTVIAVSSSHAQKNSITVGKVGAYYDSELVESDAIYHSAPLGSGGSGSALLNADLELCGVNFAADVAEKEYGNGSSIPIETVREHLTALEIFSEILN